MKLGSLFDGSGGFPLAGSLCGIEPVWASEVEPYPIAVTRARFPDMEHLGDVSKIHGVDVEPVDVITFGSPCQDMSIAGKRAGIKNENAGDDETTRSGLFYEAARIIKEMREATNGVYPRFAVWENVPGAFSSNKGEDFRLVLKTLVQIVEPTADVPPVPKSGWAYADCWMGDGWSIAYRTFDAQYWGVPQRRRRIYLVLDLGGQCAGEILFEREGLRGYFTESGAAGERTASNAKGSAGVCDKNCLTPWDVQSRRIFSCDGPWPAIYAGEGGGHGYVFAPTYCIQGNTIDRNAQQNGSGICENVVFTLNAVDRHGVIAAGFKAGQGAQARSIGWEEERVPTLAAEAGGNSVPSVCVAYDARRNGDGKTSSTITGDHENRVTDYTTVVCIQGAVVGRNDNAGPDGCGFRTDGKAYTLDTKQPSVICMAHGQANAEICNEVSPCLNCNHEQPIVFDKEVYNSGENATGGHYIAEGGPAPTLRHDSHPPRVCVHYIVRRLTPTECARLQGFPDWWGDVPPVTEFSDDEDWFWLEIRQTADRVNGREIRDYSPTQIVGWYNKLHTDSAEYKMWGNGIALPCALYVLQGIAENLVDAGEIRGRY